MKLSIDAADWAQGRYEEAATLLAELCLDDSFVELLALRTHEKID